MFALVYAGFPQFDLFFPALYSYITWRASICLFRLLCVCSLICRSTLFVYDLESTDRQRVRPVLCISLSMVSLEVGERSGTRPTAKTKALRDVLSHGEPLSPPATINYLNLNNFDKSLTWLIMVSHQAQTTGVHLEWRYAMVGKRQRAC